MMNGDANPGNALVNGVGAGAAQPSGKAIYEQRKQFGKQSINAGEISQYHVEHLVTLNLDRKEGLTTIDDAIRKLKLLEARGKVWTQEALMQVDEKAVKIFDQSSQEELENFPLPTVQSVQTTIAEPYKIVALVVKESDQKMADMHLFHTPEIPADVIHADIESALADCKDKKGRKIRPETLRRTRERVQASVIPPPPSNPPPAPPMKDGTVRDIVESWDNLAQSHDYHTGQDYNNVSKEMLTLKIQRDVQILNHLLDDIEFFVSKIRKSAEAKSELEQRKGKKTRKKKGGDGMLTLRSRLPPQEGFIETFRKLKFCFNLLAKLKSHISNPNAIEIIHYLFTPLNGFIKSCGGYDIPRSVDSPLLTRDAIDMLHNCLTTQESEVWRNLGELWGKSRAEFPEEHFFPPYVPKFRNGWEPIPIFGDPAVDENKAKELAAMVQHQADRYNREHHRSSDPSEAFKQHVEMHVQRNQNFNTAVKARMCRSLYDFAGRNKNELNVQRDELLEVVDDSKAWWKVQNKQGDIGFVPGNHMVVISHTRANSSNGSESSNPMLPPSQPVPLPPPAPKVPHPPPAIPPPPKIAPVPVNQSKPVNMNGNVNNQNNQPIYAPVKKKTGNMNDDLARELNSRVKAASTQQRNFNIPKKKPNADSMKITNNSSSSEVKQWLESLGFSQLTVDSLGVLTGAQLFTLTKEELKMVCEEDGARVFSQIQVQQSIMKNKQEGEDELSKVLSLRKARSESVE